MRLVPGLDVSGLSAMVGDSDPIALGGAHGCAAPLDDAVFCWGANDQGQMGDGSTTNRLTAVRPFDPGGSTLVVSVAAGQGHTCAATVMPYGVSCWGDNMYGQLGDGTTTNRHTPVGTGAVGTGAVAVAAGSLHTCALTGLNLVYCWGSNSQGQLGNNSTTASSSPVQVMGVTNAVQVGAGGTHSCARRSSGVVSCWGSNFFGELGNGSTTRSLLPVDVMGLTGPQSISVGDDLTCARTSAGAVLCWGYGTMTRATEVTGI